MCIMLCVTSLEIKNAKETLQIELKLEHQQEFCVKAHIVLVASDCKLRNPVAETN